MEIKILGPGCPKCQTEKIIKEAVAEAGIEIEIEKITDLVKIMTFGVISLPAVMVDGQVKSTGKVPKKEEVRHWIKKEKIAS
jgi:small redox-active disulfide protein 2